MLPSGSAGVFYHKGFRFDAGATLAGGFAAGGPHARLAERLGLVWPVQPVDPAWVVHLPGDRRISQWGSRDQWRAERLAVFPHAEPFWRIQEMLAGVAWDVSARPFPWPPQNLPDLLTLGRAIRPPALRALPYLLRTIGDLAPSSDPLFNLFLDAQLLISAQTTAVHAGALYGGAALDLPRRGVNYVRGGMGALATTLVDWIRANVFLSLSDPGDPSRAPAGMRAATLSTHTTVQPWWQLRQGDDPAAYEARRQDYVERLLHAAELALPGLGQAVRLCLPGTPVTFAFYTRRPFGMVGGFPQTSLFGARGPDTGLPNLWLVGGSIFPSQSTAGVTLGGMRVAAAVLKVQKSGSTVQ